MVHEVDRLLKAYERGALTRRQLLAGIVASATAAAGIEASSGAGEAGQASQISPLAGRVRSINHINMQVSSIQRSVEFYQKLGLPTPRPIVPPPGEATYGLDLTDGSLLSLIQIRDQEQVGTIDHFCLGIDNLRLKEDGDALRSLGLEVSNSGGAFENFDFLFVQDPDGVRIQISDTEQRWDCPAGIGKPSCSPI